MPLWWDAGTLADLVAWAATRRNRGASGGDPFVCSVQAHRAGEPLRRAAIRRRFLSACKGLGLQRLRTLTIHHGRHTFVSHALAGGRTLAEVRAAAGHANIAVTSIICMWQLMRMAVSEIYFKPNADQIAAFAVRLSFVSVRRTQVCA